MWIIDRSSWKREVNLVRSCVYFGCREEMHLLVKQHSKNTEIIWLDKYNLHSETQELIKYIFVNRIHFMHVYAEVNEMNSPLSTPKMVILSLHTRFQDKEKADMHSCKNNKAVKSLATQIKSYFQMRNDHQTASGTGFRHRRTLLCSETHERSLSSRGPFPSSFSQTLGVPQIRTSFGFCKVTFCLFAATDPKRMWKLAALKWHIFRKVFFFGFPLHFRSQKQRI